MIRYDLPDAELSYEPQLLSPAQADACLASTLEEVPWSRDEITLFGKTHLIPRMQCWMGDAGTDFAYSGIPLVPQPWTPTVRQLLELASERCEVAFNSVLINLYRDGRDHMGWHADDEKEVGRNPCIASISLGAERDFVLRHRTHTERPRTVVKLAHGSLLVMAGATQHHYKHALPKRLRVTEPRVNLTFRRLIR